MTKKKLKIDLSHERLVREVKSWGWLNDGSLTYIGVDRLKKRFIAIAWSLDCDARKKLGDEWEGYPIDWSTE